MMHYTVTAYLDDPGSDEVQIIERAAPMDKAAEIASAASVLPLVAYTVVSRPSGSIAQVHRHGHQYETIPSALRLDYEVAA